MNRGALLAQAVRGPILLITVGALFALHQAGTISFGRTWPLLIIVVGLIKLAERMLMPAAPLYQPPAPPFGQQGYQQSAYQPPQGPYQPPPGGNRV